MNIEDLISELEKIKEDNNGATILIANGGHKVELRFVDVEDGKVILEG